jgi:hypothetical protein
MPSTISNPVSVANAMRFSVLHSAIRISYMGADHCGFGATSSGWWALVLVNERLRPCWRAHAKTRRPTDR